MEQTPRLREWVNNIGFYGTELHHHLKYHCDDVEKLSLYQSRASIAHEENPDDRYWIEACEFFKEKLGKEGLTHHGNGT